MQVTNNPWWNFFDRNWIRVEPWRKLTQEERNWTGVEHVDDELFLSRNKQMVLAMRREERRDKASK